MDLMSPTYAVDADGGPQSHRSLEEIRRINMAPPELDWTRDRGEQGDQRGEPQHMEDAIAAGRPGG